MPLEKGQRGAQFMGLELTPAGPGPGVPSPRFHALALRLPGPAWEKRGDLAEAPMDSPRVPSFSEPLCCSPGLRKGRTPQRQAAEEPAETNRSHPSNPFLYKDCEYACGSTPWAFGSVWPVCARPLGLEGLSCSSFCSLSQIVAEETGLYTQALPLRLPPSQTPCDVAWGCILYWVGWS